MTQFLIGITVTFVLLLLFSRWKLWIGVFAGAVTFGLINLGWQDTVAVSLQTVSSINNWFLVIAVGLIPVLGGIISDSIHMNVVLGRLKGNKKLYLMIAPALFGLIPIPGGALMSCPLLKDFDKNISASKSVAINIWFRHVFVIVYPLSSSLIIASQLAGLTIMQAIMYMLPYMVIIVIVGYFILLADVKNDATQVAVEKPAKHGKDVLILGIILLTAPILHILLAATILRSYEQLSFFISMVTGVVIATAANRISIGRLLKIISRSRVDQFSLLFLFLLVFINVIRAYDQLDTIFSGFTPPLVIVGFFAFMLSFISGRIEIALSIVYPLLFAAYGSQNLPGILFSFIYFSLFAGYLVAPLHPCMAFSLEYFQTKYLDVLKKLFPLILIPLTLISIIVAILY